MGTRALKPFPVVPPRTKAESEAGQVWGVREGHVSLETGFLSLTHREPWRVARAQLAPL